jgi:hypothetical protein
MNQEFAKTKENDMASAIKNRKQDSFQLLQELDDCIMEGWSTELPIGEVLDSIPGNLRQFFEQMKLATTPENNGDGTYTITFKI